MSEEIVRRGQGERARAYRKRNEEAGLCPNHGTPVAEQKHCHVCRPESLSAIAPGAKLEACIWCDQCNRYYHAGTYYRHEDSYRHLYARKLRGIQEGPNDSLINYDKRSPDGKGKLWSLCGKCRAEGHNGPEFWKYRSSGWSGICARHRPSERMQKDDVPHPSGAIVHTASRHAEPGARKRLVKVDFTCANHARGEHRGVAYLSQTKTKNWRGLCPDCQRAAGAPKKRVEDVHVGEIGRGVWLRFSREDERHVPMEYEVCGCTKLAKRQTALSLLNAGRTTGVCVEHRNNPAAYMSSNGNGQKKRKAQKRGPKAKPSVLETTKNAACVLYKGALADVTYEAIAQRLQRAGDTITPKAVELRFKRAGYQGKREDVVLQVLKEAGKLQ